MSKLHDMEFGEIEKFGIAEVIRVPGGWVFIYPVSAVFVPYTEEFKDESI